ALLSGLGAFLEPCGFLRAFLRHRRYLRDREPRIVAVVARGLHNAAEVLNRRVACLAQCLVALDAAQPFERLSCWLGFRWKYRHAIGQRRDLTACRVNLPGLVAPA